MDSILIKNTTKEEREQIVPESIGNINGACDGCAAGLAEMYRDYIDGRKEIRDINMEFSVQHMRAIKHREYEFAEEKDIRELYDLQLRAFESEAEMIGSRNVPALMESYEENREDFDKWTVLVKRDDSGKIIGAARYREEDDHVEIGRVMVAPEWRNRGIAMGLMTAVEDLTRAKVFELYTCTKSYININLYKKLGYKIYKVEQGDIDLSFAYMRKKRIYD